MAPKIAIVYYSLFGNTRVLAEAEKRGVEKAGGTADIYQLPEVLPAEALAKLNAPPQDTSIPLITPSKLEEYDGFIFGVPTRYGTFPSQWTAFWDAAEPQWRNGAYWGKLAGAFVVCANVHCGQEVTFLNLLPTFAHHGLIYVSTGFANNDIQGNFDTVSGGSPWGAGAYVGTPYNSRLPTKDEIVMAERQGSNFCYAFADC